MISKLGLLELSAGQALFSSRLVHLILASIVSGGQKHHPIHFIHLKML
jgi:hypothetical protein